MAQMFDSVSVAGIPSGATLVAGYVDGLYANYEALVKAFPHAYVLPITVTGLPNVRVCDCEAGDLTPEHAAKWAAAELKANRRPTIYCSKSSWGAVIQWLDTLRIHHNAVDFWIAAWEFVGHRPTHTPAIPAGAVALQYAANVPNGNGHNYDQSVTLGNWPHPTPPPPHPTAVTPPPHVVPPHVNVNPTPSTPKPTITITVPGTYTKVD